MTVKELKQKIEKFPDNMSVVVYRERDNGSEASNSELFDITAVDSVTGNPVRDKNGRAGMTFLKDGSATWLFLTIEEA